MVNIAHFQDPDSLRIAAITATHGKYIKVKSSRQNTTSDPYTFCPLRCPSLYRAFTSFSESLSFKSPP